VRPIEQITGQRPSAERPAQGSSPVADGAMRWQASGQVIV
jgi:hypothetical protein